LTDFSLVFRQKRSYGERHFKLTPPGDTVSQFRYTRRMLREKKEAKTGEFAR